MRTKTIEDSGISITLSEADIEQELRRGWMADDGLKAVDARQAVVAAAEKSGEDMKADDLDDPIIRMMRTFTWPTFAACVVAATGVLLPITFEAFRHLPGGLLSQWGDAVYELNPRWNPNKESAEDPKAESGPTPSL